MSVRTEQKTNPTAEVTNAIADAQPANGELAEGNNFAVASPEHPLSRNLVVSIRSSLNDLCLQKTKGTWAPTGEALKSIFQQKKFTSLDGTSEPCGDLKSVVLHDMKARALLSNLRPPTLRASPAALLTVASPPHASVGRLRT
jgi:hypothetical protein